MDLLLENLWSKRPDAEVVGDQDVVHEAEE